MTSGPIKLITVTYRSIQLESRSNILMMIPTYFSEQKPGCFWTFLRSSFFSKQHVRRSNSKGRIERIRGYITTWETDTFIESCNANGPSLLHLCIYRCEATDEQKARE